MKLINTVFKSGCCYAVFLLMLGCSAEADVEVPEHIRNLENLIVYSSGASAPDTMLFTREQVFTGTDEVLIRGSIGDIAVDEQNRVYIVAARMGEVGIYIFAPNGSYLTRIGRRGKGPGEFTVISGIQIGDDHLYVYGNRQRKLSIFSTSDFSLVYEATLNSNEDLKDLSPSGNFFVSGTDTLLMGFNSNMATNEHRLNVYYRINREGQIVSDKIVELREPWLYMPNSKFNSDGFFRPPATMPFSRGPLVAVAGDGAVFTAWTEHFLIKAHDETGRYRHAFYYQYENPDLSVSESEFGEGDLNLIEENSGRVPATWPALHGMFFDDRDRLWVLTITDSDSTYNGRVVSREGELLARFVWPGNRSARSAEFAPELVVKNGYLYSHERSLREGIDQVVKYRIEMN